MKKIRWEKHYDNLYVANVGATKLYCRRGNYGDGVRLVWQPSADIYIESEYVNRSGRSQPTLKEAKLACIEVAKELLDKMANKIAANRALFD